jgi:hypothetical protein
MATLIPGAADAWLSEQRSANGRTKMDLRIKIEQIISKFGQWISY